jgi:hypothetical protein
MKIMQYKGFNAKIMRAERLTGSGVHGLPPGSAIDVLPVDAFESPLSHWIKGAGNYVVPVDSDWGLWFDFTSNDKMNTAVLLSIKGMNPVTGQRTNGLELERYEEKCPVHKAKFKDGLFCEKCNYKWPDQNYIAYPNTLWWDGFRSSDGKVRQFFFTEDMAKSVPELVIGKEDTVPAFGFAFFRPKVARAPAVVTQRIGGAVYGAGILGSYDYVYDSHIVVDETHNYFSSVSNAASSPSVMFCNATACAGGASAETGQLSTQNVQVLKKHTRSAKAEVGVGAGAEISQNLEIDSLKVSDWENEPASVMRLYFMFVEQFEEIKSKGTVDLVGEKEGYLSGLPVG